MKNDLVAFRREGAGRGKTEAIAGSGNENASHGSVLAESGFARKCLHISHLGQQQAPRRAGLLTCYASGSFFVREPSMIQGCVVRTEHAPPQRAFVKNGVDIYTCPTCGCIMADVEFVHDQYENDGYYTMSQKTTADIERHWGFRWRHVLQTLQRHVAKPSVLDVGAGNGYFVHVARTEFGLHADGLEISDAEAAYARQMFGLELLRGDISDVRENYDAVCSFNVIEHVPDPAALLSAMLSKVKPGGYLVVTTPNPSCVHRRVKGLQNWGMVQPLTTSTCSRGIHWRR